MKKDGKVYSLDNRRLKAYKDAGVTDAPIIVEDLNKPEILKEFRKKYSTKDDGATVRIETAKERKARKAAERDKTFGGGKADGQ